MKKTNKISILTLAGILSFGLINNPIYAAAAKTPVDELIEAAKNGDVEAVRAILEARVDVNATNNYGETALMHAADSGHSNVTTQLIQANANVNAANMNCMTALMWATRKNYNNLVTQLIEAKAYINATNNNRETALLMAAYQGHKVVVAQLIKARANVDATNNNRETALMWAAQQGHNVVVAQLIEARANVDATNNNRETALMWAAQQGHNEVVAQLIEARANFNVPDSRGKTALMQATKQGHNDVAAQLIEAKAKADDFFEAATDGDVEEVRTLLEARVDVNVTTNDSSTALMLAAYQGHNDVIVQLIEAKANLDAVDQLGMTALMLTTYFGCHDVAAQLTGARANVAAQLMVARANVAAKLIGAKANIDATNNDGRTALLMAAAQGNNDVTAQLIEARANFFANSNRETPLIAIAQRGDHDLAQLLMYGLLSRQMLQTQKQMGCLGTYNSTCGDIGEHCGALTQLPADSLNRILWYIGAQECHALRQTCRGLSQLQPDILGLSAMARQGTCRKLLYNCAQCDENIKQGETAYLWEYLIEFLEDEEQAPVCNIATWEASIQCAIKKRCTTENEIKKEPLSHEHVHALERLIHIIKKYHQESIALVKAPATAQCPAAVAVAQEATQGAPVMCAIAPYADMPGVVAPSATALCTNSMLTVCPDLQDVAGQAPSLMAQAIAVAQPDAQRDEEELQLAIALSLE